MKRALSLLVLAGILGATGLMLGLYLREGAACEGGIAPTEIFQGITYGCVALPPSEEARGALHWVRVDLNAPGIGIYVTPLDPTAVSEGWQFRLRSVADVVDKEHLAVAVNGTLFGPKPAWRPRFPGERANAVEPVVADGVPSHRWTDAYLLWFDDAMTAHLRPQKPIKPAEFDQARWGIGGQDFWLRDGRVWKGSRREPDARTALGVDLERNLLFLAVGAHISPRVMFETLAELGAVDGMLLDGGDSSSMAIGEGASGISPGVVFGRWRPVATQFGVRALPLGTPKGAERRGD